MHQTQVFPKQKKNFNTKLHQRVEEVSGVEAFHLFIFLREKCRSISCEARLLARNIAVQLYIHAPRVHSLVL